MTCPICNERERAPLPKVLGGGHQETCYQCVAVLEQRHRSAGLAERIDRAARRSGAPARALAAARRWPTMPDELAAWVEGVEGFDTWTYLHGPSHTGKTTAAAVATLALLERVEVGEAETPVRWLSMPRINAQLAEVEWEVGLFARAEYLVLDEVGRGADTRSGGGYGRALEIIHTRYDEGLPTLLCGNAGLRDLADSASALWDEAMVWRIYEATNSGARVVQMKEVVR